MEERAEKNMMAKKWLLEDNFKHVIPSLFCYSWASGSSPFLLGLVCSDFSFGGCFNFGFFGNHDRWVFLCKRYFHMRAGSEPGIIGPWEAKGFRFSATAVFNDTFPHTSWLQISVPHPNHDDQFEEASVTDCISKETLLFVLYTEADRTQLLLVLWDLVLFNA